MGREPRTWQPSDSSLHGPLPLDFFPFLSFLRQRRDHIQLTFIEGLPGAEPTQTSALHMLFPLPGNRFLPLLMVTTKCHLSSEVPAQVRMS